MPPVVVQAPQTAPLSDEGREQAVTTLTFMINQWWSGGQGRSTGAHDGSGRHGVAAPGDQLSGPPGSSPGRLSRSARWPIA
jgi:hypothetical protein